MTMRTRTCLQICSACQARSSTDIMLQYGLNSACFKAASTCCQVCHGYREGLRLELHEWSFEGCKRLGYYCNGCEETLGIGKLFCRSCYREAGNHCIVCRLQSAQTERKYMHCCKSCIGSISLQTHFGIVRVESDAYLRKMLHNRSGQARILLCSSHCLRQHVCVHCYNMQLIQCI